MIQFVNNKDIDPEKWNQTVDNALFSTVFCHYELLGQLTQPNTWHALVQGDYEAVMPLPTRKKWGIPYIYTPFFLPQMGIFAPGTVSIEQTKAFMDAIPEKYAVADIILNTGNRTDCPTAMLTSHELKLQASYEALRAGYAHNTQRNIKDAERQQVRIRFQEPVVENVIRLFRENRGKEHSVHFGPDDYDRLVTIAKALNEQDALLTASARTTDGDLAGGALFVRDGKRLWFWFSGRDYLYAAQKPMFLLLDAVIREHAASNLTLDFNGSINPNVARMYQSFGGVPYPVPLVSIIHKPLVQKISTTLRGMRK